MKKPVLVLLTLLLVTGSANAVVAHPVRIGVPLGDSELKLKLQQQVANAYTQLGYQPEFIALPSQRRLRLLRNGLIDADLFRICQLDQAYPELLVVPATLDTLRLNAYSLVKETLTNWQQREELLVSHIRGFKMADQQTFAGARVLVNNDQQAFGLMLQGRVNIVLEDSRSAAHYLAQQENLPAIAEQYVAEYPVCHIVNRKLSELSPALAEKLR